jgi:hypothetical protein
VSKTVRVSQHCTNKRCPYQHVHTGLFCGWPQKIQCDCGYCYRGVDRQRNIRWR